MKSIEMIDFINKELIPQVESEIKNWVYPKKSNGGYFVVVRQIFCILDFLGAVYSGYPLSERKKDKDAVRISTSSKTIRFIEDFFTPKDTYDHYSIKIIHFMYRNGLVHLYQPKCVKLRGNKEIKWFIYRGKRQLSELRVNSDFGMLVFKNVSHMKLLSHPQDKHKIYLPICIDSLYEDFENAIKLYCDRLLKTKCLQGNWRTAVNAISRPQWM